MPFSMIARHEMPTTCEFRNNLPISLSLFSFQFLPTNLQNQTVIQSVLNQPFLVAHTFYVCEPQRAHATFAGTKQCKSTQYQP